MEHIVKKNNKKDELLPQFVFFMAFKAVCLSLLLIIFGEVKVLSCNSYIHLIKEILAFHGLNDFDDDES